MFRRGGNLLSVVLALALCTTCGMNGPRKLNLVVIALDTLRPDHLGCYGYSRATSPNIDAWAKNAVVFENAQSAAPWTAPSLLSLMTSLYPEVHGVVRFPDPGQMSGNVTTLAEFLKQSGYRTAAFTDGGYAKPQFGLKQGFDYYPLNKDDGPHEHASNIAHPDRIKNNLERTLVWLEEHGDDPFFLFFHTYQIHAPYCPPAQYVTPFRPGYDEASEHARLAEVIQHWVSAREIDAAGVRLILAHQEHCLQPGDPAYFGLPAKMKEFGIGSLDPDRMQFWRDMYDGEIAYTDSQLKRLLDELEKPELRDNTVVVFVSDHGEGFGEHGTTQHGSVLLEEDLHVLFMLRAPGVAPHRVKDLVRSIDMMPTTLELLGSAFERTRLQGRSLVPLLRGESLPPVPSFSHANNKNGREASGFSIRDGKWRLVIDRDQQTSQLYDLESDPLELSDVAAQNPKIAERLQGLLNAQRDLDADLFKRVSGPVGDYVFDKDTEDELRRIGYLGDGPPPKREDPKTAPPGDKKPDEPVKQ